MAILRETIHHALGTFARGAELPDDHPLVVAVPEFFDEIGASDAALLGWLAEQFPGADEGTLQEHLARLLFAAQVWGRLNGQD